MTKPVDVDYSTLINCYSPSSRIECETFFAPARHAQGGTEIWHALIGKNHGCPDFIVGPRSRGPGRDTYGKPFYGLYEAQEVFKKHDIRPRRP